jgi:hypothetical protein
MEAKGRARDEIAAGQMDAHRNIGHVSRARLSRYSHVRMDAKRRALDEIAAGQSAADEKRKKVEKQQQGLVVAQSAAIQ